MSEKKTYSGGCHCGHVRFEAATDLTPVMSCNCSICSKRGFLLTFIPPQQFRLQSGGDDLVEYRFNKHVISHLFCPICGVQAFARGKGPNGAETIALNVRCLDDIDVSALTPTPFNGKAL